MAFEKPIPRQEWVFLFTGDRETRGERLNEERRGATIQMELTHEAEEAQFQPGNDERRIA